MDFLITSSWFAAGTLNKIDDLLIVFLGGFKIILLLWQP